MQARMDGRAPRQLREIKITPDFTANPLASVLVEFGATKVLCTVCCEEPPPKFVPRGRGWVTAEYSMLPGATNTRGKREAARGRQSGRTMEIQRLIGRSLRAVLQSKALGERVLHVDCDVLQADGGTRTASVTGAWAALALAARRLQQRGVIDAPPLRGSVAAVSVGLVGGRALLDLNYEEDSRADVDMNVVATGEGALAEVQATGEGATFTFAQQNELLELALEGAAQLSRLQQAALAAAK